MMNHTGDPNGTSRAITPQPDAQAASADVGENSAHLQAALAMEQAEFSAQAQRRASANSKAPDSWPISPETILAVMNRAEKIRRDDGQPSTIAAAIYRVQEAQRAFSREILDNGPGTEKLAQEGVELAATALALAEMTQTPF